MVPTFPLVAAGLLLGQAAAPETPSAPVAPSAKIYIYQNGQLVPYNDGSKGTASWRSPADAAAAPSRPLLTRIQGWFGKHPADATPPPGAISGVDTTTKIIRAPVMPPAQTAEPAVAPTTPAPSAAPAAPAAPPGEFPRKLPATQTITPKTEVLIVPQGSTVVLPKTGGIMPTKTDAVRTAVLKSSPPPASTAPTAAAASVPASTSSPILPANLPRIGRDEKFAWVTGQLEVEKGQYVLYYATPETVDPHHGRIVLSGAKVDLRAFHSGDLVSAHGQLQTGRAGAVYQVTSADLIDRARK